MTDTSKSRGVGFVLVVAVLLIVIGLCLPADAHSQAEQDAWYENWIWRLSLAGDLNSDLMAELTEFRRLHPPAPPPPPPSSQISTTATKTASGAPEGVFRGMGADVEQWRSLVATYFPAEHVDRMLRIMKCESGGNPYAHNTSTDVRGLFQIRYPLWSKVWPGDYFDPWTNVAIAYQVWLIQGYGAWECNRLI